MAKTILITGATDGIGLHTAHKIADMGHTLLLHGRNPDKLQAIAGAISKVTNVKSYIADLANLSEVHVFVDKVKSDYKSLDVLINNAGILRSNESIKPYGYDLRFIVNTVAPYLLTQELMPLFHKNSRIINLSSAAQLEVNFDGLQEDLDPMKAYAQSKLAITMWSNAMANFYKNNGPSILSVNPGSLLASKMVKEGFGIDGKDINIGSDILVRLALSDEFHSDSGKYFDNDKGCFANPHSDAMDKDKCVKMLEFVESVVKDICDNNI